MQEECIRGFLVPTKQNSRKGTFARIGLKEVESFTGEGIHSECDCAVKVYFLARFTEYGKFTGAY